MAYVLIVVVAVLDLLFKVYTHFKCDNRPPQE